MKKKNVSSRFDRRDFFRYAGAASLAGFSGFGTAVNADTGRITADEFNYPFRTFSRGQKLRIGMIGTDGHTGFILTDYAKVPNAELVAYANHGGSALNLPAGIRLYEGYEEMLEKEELNLVGICLPLSLNARAAMTAAAKGVHIMVEKPVAIRLEDLYLLKSAVIKNRVRLTTLLNMRTLPEMLAIRDAVREGKIGEPILATAQKSYRWGGSRPDYYRKHETYGGTIPWIGIHAMDYIHFTAHLDFTEVAAFQGNKNHPDYPGCEDYAGVVLRLSNGGTAMVNLDYLRPEKAPTHGDDRLRIAGSEGVIELKDLATRVELITAGSEPINLALPEGTTLIEDFVRELRGEGKHLLSQEEPFEMTRVALLAHQAAAKGEIIRL